MVFTKINIPKKRHHRSSHAENRDQPSITSAKNPSALLASIFHPAKKQKFSSLSFFLKTKFSKNSFPKIPKILKRREMFL